MKIFLSLLLILGACSFKKNQLDNQTLKGHEELYSEPDQPKLKTLGTNERRIIIAATNDLHGEYEAHSIKFEDDHNKKDLSTTVGGKDVIKNYFQNLRDTYKDVILVDSGDIFSKAKKQNDVKDFYASMDYDAMTVGLRDFNLKVPSHLGSNTDMFQDFSKKSKVPLLLSNLYELKTARNVEWSGTKPYLMKEVGGVKVGIIGLIPDDIVALTPVNNRVGLFVESMLQSTLKHSRLLRSLGAEVIVVLTHQGVDCSSKLAEESKLPVMKVNFEPKRENICELNNVLGTYLERLPPSLVDVVVGGRNNQKMSNFINGVLVMSSFPDGKSFNYVELTINKDTKRIVPEKTIPHQPVVFCHEFFKETKDCFTEDESVDHKERTPATFLGKPILAPKLSTYLREDLDFKKDSGKALVQFDADISFIPPSSGETQLFTVAITGRELIKVLEEDFNSDRKDYWSPSPFLVKDNELNITISGLEPELDKTYFIIADLESLQMHKSLIPFIGRNESKAIMNDSWNSMEEDTISTQLAGRAR